MVVKRSGVTEPFSRTKVINGVRKACQGRPVTEDALAQLGQRVEETVRATGSAELTTHDVGLAILGPLQELDLVAYLRFASVYRAFDSLEDFESAIADKGEPCRGRGRPRALSRGTGKTTAGPEGLFRSPSPPGQPAGPPVLGDAVHVPDAGCPEGAPFFRSVGGHPCPTLRSRTTASSLP